MDNPRNGIKKGVRNVDPIRVFFRGTVGGGPNAAINPEKLAEFYRIIQRLDGTFSSKAQAQPEPIGTIDELSPTQIHDAIYMLMQWAEVGIFEISHESHEVGALIADILSLGKPVLCLFQGFIQAQYMYILGKAGTRFCQTRLIYHSYRDMTDVEQIIAEFLEDHRKHRH